MFLPCLPSLVTNRKKNLCVRRYFKCFNHLFPIIHSATFRPTPENGLLLLSIASVGALFLGSQSAVRHGSRLFKRLNKAIVANVYMQPGIVRNHIDVSPSGTTFFTEEIERYLL